MAAANAEMRRRTRVAVAIVQMKPAKAGTTKICAAAREAFAQLGARTQLIVFPEAALDRLLSRRRGLRSRALRADVLQAISPERGAPRAETTKSTSSPASTRTTAGRTITRALYLHVGARRRAHRAPPSQVVLADVRRFRRGAVPLARAAGRNVRDALRTHGDARSARTRGTRSYRRSPPSRARAC